MLVEYNVVGNGKSWIWSDRVYLGVGEDSFKVGLKVVEGWVCLFFY